MTEQRGGGLFPSDPFEFQVLLRRPPNPPRVPTVEEIKRDPQLAHLVERQTRRDFDAMRAELSLVLTEIMNQELIEETDAAVGSKKMRAKHMANFQKFAAWCESQGYPSLPSCPEVLALYLISMEAKPSALQRIIDSVAYYHHWVKEDFNPTDEHLTATLKWAGRVYNEPKSQLVEREEIKPNGSGSKH